MTMFVLLLIGVYNLAAVRHYFAKIVQYLLIGWIKVHINKEIVLDSVKNAARLAICIVYVAALLRVDRIQGRIVIWTLSTGIYSVVAQLRTGDTFVVIGIGRRIKS